MRDASDKSIRVQDSQQAIDITTREHDRGRNGTACAVCTQWLPGNHAPRGVLQADVRNHSRRSNTHA